MKLIFINNKGGSGKTTAAVHLAWAYREGGKAVTLLDIDPQQTATNFLKVFPGVSAANGEITLVDCPPRLDAPGIAKHLKEANVCLLPSLPSPPDLWTTAQSVAQIQKLAPDLKLRLLFMGVEAHTTLGSMLDDLAEQVKVTRLQNYLAKRTAYRMSGLLGPKALTSEAQNELFKLAMEIATIK